jgi:hypothetical protein
MARGIGRIAIGPSGAGPARAAREGRESASRQKRTSERLPRYVRFVPNASLTRCSKLAPVSAAIWVFGQPLAPPGRRTVVSMRNSARLSSVRL